MAYGNDDEVSDDSKKFNRRFRTAIIVFAIVEFMVTALVMVYMARR